MAHHKKIDWMSLPEVAWENILNFMDFTTLLETSQVCKKLNDIFSHSERFQKEIVLMIDLDTWQKSTEPESREGKSYWVKLKLELRKYANTGFNNDEDSDRQYEAMQNYQMMQLKVLAKSQRPYKQVVVSDFWMSRGIENFVSATKNCFDVLNQKADEVFLLSPQTDGSDFLFLLGNFTNARRLVVSQLSSNMRNESVFEILHWPNLRELKLFRMPSWALMFFQTCSNLTVLDLMLSFKKMKDFEEFLMMQADLKYLRISTGCFEESIFFPTTSEKLFPVDRSADVRFRLDKLMIGCVEFQSEETELNFFKTQTELKEVGLSLTTSNFFYNEIITFIFSGLRQLHTVTIENFGLDIEDVDFLQNIVNEKITKMKLLEVKGRSSKILFTKLIEICSNLTTFIYETANDKSSESDDQQFYGMCEIPEHKLDADVRGKFKPGNLPALNDLKKLEALSVRSCARTLINVMIASSPALTTFEFRGKFLEKDAGEMLLGFLKLHQSIEHLTVANCTVFTGMCTGIIEALPKLTSLAFHNCFLEFKPCDNVISEKLKLTKFDDLDMIEWKRETLKKKLVVIMQNKQLALFSLEYGNSRGKMKFTSTEDDICHIYKEERMMQPCVMEDFV